MPSAVVPSARSGAATRIPGEAQDQARLSVLEFVVQNPLPRLQVRFGEEGLVQLPCILWILFAIEVAVTEIVKIAMVRVLQAQGHWTYSGNLDLSD